MKRLLCVIAILLAFQPEAFAQYGGFGEQRGTDATGEGGIVLASHHVRHPRRVVVVRPARHHRRVVVVRPRHRVVRDVVRCRDGVVRTARPGACAGHGGYRR